MNKRQWKKYRKRNYCWTYKEYKRGNIYHFIQWCSNRSGKSKVLVYDGVFGKVITRNRRVYPVKVLQDAYKQFNEDVASGKYSNRVFYGEFDHPTTQSFEIEIMGKLLL